VSVEKTRGGLYSLRAATRKALDAESRYLGGDENALATLGGCMRRVRRICQNRTREGLGPVEWTSVADTADFWFGRATFYGLNVPFPALGPCVTASQAVDAAGDEQTSERTVILLSFRRDDDLPVWSAQLDAIVKDHLGIKREDSGVGDWEMRAGGLPGLSDAADDESSASAHPEDGPAADYSYLHSNMSVHSSRCHHAVESRLEIDVSAIGDAIEDYSWAE